MFILNGNVNSWKISKEEKSFTVSNTRGDVSFTVVNADMSRFVDPEPNEKNFVNADIYPDTGLVVRYDDKSMIPVGNGNNEKRKDTMLAAVSINLKQGFHFTSVYNNGALIYGSSFERERFVDIIANFSKARNDKPFYPSIKIVAINDETDEIVSYFISYSKNKKRVMVNMSRTNKADNPDKGEKGHINTFDYVKKVQDEGRDVIAHFYPSSPSHVILTDAGFRDKLEDIIKAHDRWRAPHMYTIHEGITSEALQQYADEGYKAITIFIDENVDQKYFHEKYDWRTNSAIAEAVEKYDTVYLIGTNGKLYKLKTGGIIHG